MWAKNLTNKAHLITPIDFGPGFGNLQNGNYNESRTFGVIVTAR